MAIKFIPSNQEVTLAGQEEHQKALLSLLRCAINGLNRVEKQLEKLTDESIDDDEGTII